MTVEGSYINERLDHLGIVAGVCQEIGLAAWLDAQAPGNRQQVSVGTATVAMVLNGLGWLCCKKSGSDAMDVKAHLPVQLRQPLQTSWR